MSDQVQCWRVTYVDAETEELGASCLASEADVAAYLERFPPAERVMRKDGSVRAGNWLITLECEELDPSLLIEEASNDSLLDLLADWEAA